MLFNSFRFLIFFPAVCLIYYIIPFRIQHVFLLAVSYYFYMCWNPRYAILMTTSTLITYFSGILIEQAKKSTKEKWRIFWMRFFVTLSFILNLSILICFKYLSFLMESLNVALNYFHMAPISGSFDVLLPVGISFYTFQALSYTVDVYRGDIYCEKNILKYALFVSFFPQLVSGPIERSKNLLRQISIKRKCDWNKICRGLTQMLFGYFQKMVISDQVAVLVDGVYNHYTEYDSIELILATLLFATQIYCDFGGYSNIAIGAAKVMGFELMENFNAPYMACSVADFWRRWHISLSSWFRDYLYIPLGGNRKGRFRKYVNLLFVFLISGLWHGASWHFVIWGALNGLYQIVGEILEPVRNGYCKFFEVNRNSFSHRLAKGIFTFILVDISWIFFRAETVGSAIEIIVQIANRWDPWVLFDNSLFKLGLGRQQFHMVCVAILVLIFIDMIKYYKIDFFEKVYNQGMWFRFSVNLILIFWILICGNYGLGYDASQFIYFQF